MTEEIRKIVQAERRRASEAAARLARRLDEARAEARRLAARFAIEEPSLRRVILFGSVATGRVRADGFDIDLAVDADRLGSILCAAEGSEFAVDLLDLRSASSRLRRVIEEKGVLLYGEKR
jgi:predicted nucleotidyltransferase